MSMVRILRLCLVAAAFVAASLLLGCGPGGIVITDKRQALETALRVEASDLTYALRDYQQKHGSLPMDLRDLVRDDAWLTNIDFSVFSYSPTGVVTVGAVTWLLSTPDPLAPGQVIAGTIPPKVDSVPIQTNR